MDIRIFIVGAGPGERTTLRRLARPRRHDAARMLLLFHDSFTSADSDAGGQPDLVLFDPACVRADSLGGMLARSSGPLGNTPSAALRHLGTEPDMPLPAGPFLLLHSATALSFRAFVEGLISQAGCEDTAPGRYSLSDIVLGSIADAVISTDRKGRVSYLNAAAACLLDVDANAVVDTPIMDLMSLRDRQTGLQLQHPVLQVMASGHTARLPAGTVVERPDGSTVPIEDATSPIRTHADGDVLGAVMVFHDVTAAQQLQAEVDYLAWHDFLTGLPNRFAAQRHLAGIVAEAQLRHVPLAVMYLDLDRFKLVNDTLGHAAGDELLVAVAVRLKSCFRIGDMISRQGGDEFVVLMAPGSGSVDAVAAAQRILAALAEPVAIDQDTVHIGCSIGIALYPEHGKTGDALLRHADTALHSAKAAGRNTWHFFHDDLLSVAIRRREVDSGLREAVGNSSIQLFYQPKIRLADGSLCGCEALLRWHHPEWGWVSPDRFIRNAEESGFIVQLGDWVLAQAIRQARRWSNAGYRCGPIAVNVSAVELRQARFADGLARQLVLARIDPMLLQLELTESALMRDVGQAAQVLLALKSLGLSIAIDDFGTGYSSLSYLADLPIDTLKVDRSFVHGIHQAQPRRRALLQAILSLAASLGLPVVAEGIETTEEAAFLKEAGCTLGQGYFYGHALDAQTFEARFLMPAAGTP
jgi:diguanylate cyclase (GGDEF)-like protein/PAS domain S-box-containing protein